MQTREPEICRVGRPEKNVRKSRGVVSENVGVVVRWSPPLIRRGDPRSNTEVIEANSALAEIDLGVWLCSVPLGTIECEWKLAICEAESADLTVPEERKGLILRAKRDRRDDSRRSRSSAVPGRRSRGGT